MDRRRVSVGNRREPTNNERSFASAWSSLKTFPVDAFTLDAADATGRGRRLRGGVLAVFVLMCCPAPAGAEVLDKELPESFVWAWALLASVFGYFVVRWKPSLILLTLPVGLLLPSIVLLEVFDPYVGSHITREAGMSYAASAWGSVMLVLALQIAGLAVGVRRRRLAS